MLHLWLIILALLQQGAPAMPPRDGAIHMQGHAYRLFCSFASDPTFCIGKGGVEVDQFDVRDETGQTKFHLEAPAGLPFANVLISGMDSQILTVGVGTRAHNSANQVVFHYYNFYFETTTNGLVPFAPSLTCANGSMYDSTSSTGNGLGCSFPTDYFTFMVGLVYNFEHHRILLAPKQNVFGVLSPLPSLPLKAKAATRLELYRDHQTAAIHSTVSILPGENVKLLAAWSPVSIGPIENAPEGSMAVSFDSTRVWLQIQLNGQVGWIQGSSSYEAIGLDYAATRG